MEFFISDFEQYDSAGKLTKGFTVTICSKTGKKSLQESDFFPNGSEIETNIQQLKKQLKKYFDANP